MSSSNWFKPAWIAASTVLLTSLQAHAGVIVKSLAVEYRATPLGIDVAEPRFSWQMSATAGERGIAQRAYEIEVKNPKGGVVWDSRRVESASSLGILYAGYSLQPATRYSWNVTVWDQAGAKLTAASWFETGLMDPKPNSPAWSNAKWIGGGESDQDLYSHYLPLFEVEYSITIAPGSTRAAFLYAANDARLMNQYKNIYQVESARDQSYFKIELDLSPVNRPDGRARINVYRAGYTPTDNPAQPVRTFEIPAPVINAANQNAAHVIRIHSVFGQVTLTVDGNASLSSLPAPTPPNTPGGRGPAPNSVNFNPVGAGGDVLTYGLLCDIGFSVDPGQHASFRDLTIRNDHAPNHVLFREDLSASPYKGIFADAAVNSGLTIAAGAYSLNGGAKGLTILRDPSHNSMPMLRTLFRATKPIAAARLYVTSRGIYELYLNGKRIGDEYYNPGMTQYNVTHFYQTYDVTSMLHPGPNALGAMLGEGWWSGLLGYGPTWNQFGDRQSLLLKLALSYKDGSQDVVTTDPAGWKYFAAGPITYSSLDMGEVYDATRERAVDGWSTAAYNDARWHPAVEVPLAGSVSTGPEGDFSRLSLIGQIGSNAGVFRVLTAKSVKEVRPGVFVYNLGQNIVGVPRIAIANGHRGAQITLRYAEMLYPNLPAYGKNVGMIMTENYRAALSQDLYTMKAGPQTIQPHFTSHGFQYIEITGVEKPLPLSAVQGVAISSVRELTADYKTSSDKVNRLWSNLVWSNIDNFLTIPTDCPQRNERLGWSGDINVFSRTATYLSNTDQFFTRHMYAMRDVQSPAGRFLDVSPIGGGFGGVLRGSAGIVVPWETYLQYMDTALLQRHYPAMAAYVDYLEGTINPTTGITSDGALGDWLGPQNNLLGTPFLTSAYFAYDLGIVAQAADVLDRPADAAKYRALYEKRRAFFNATFVNADKKTMAIGDGRNQFGPSSGPPLPLLHLVDSQTSYAVGLGMGLFNDDNRPFMVQNLSNAVARENKDDEGKVRPPYSLMTGFIGTAWISKALSDGGLYADAYKLLENEQYPSWLYPVDQGATSIWERLNGYTVENGFGGNNGMNSFNHYSFGAVGQWMIAYSLGIQRDEPGFQKFILQPEPDPAATITSAEGYYDSMYGRIASAWKLDGKALTYRAAVPANTTATLYLPAKAPEDVKEGAVPASQAKGVKFLRFENGKAVYQLSAGAYAFSAPQR